MFFSSCSGGPLREKLRSFWRDLREFSRTAVGRDGRRVGVGGSFAGKRVAVRRWLRAGRGWRWRPVWQGLQRLLAATLTIEMHSVAIGRRRGMSTTPRPSADRAARSPFDCTVFRVAWRPGCPHLCRHALACFDAHRRNSQRGEWVSAGDIHIGEGVSRRSAARLRRSNAQGREWVSRLERRAETCMPGNCRLALMVEVRWVASGFISRTDAPDPACCTIAGGRSTWKCFGSRVGYLPERHAGTRMLRNREPALSVETYWVASGIIRRTGALVHACRAIAGPHSSWRCFGSRAGLSAGHVRRNAHTAQSRAALTVEIHRASSVCNSGYPRPIRPCRPATRAPSPLKTTALRVVRDAGYPHACAFADAMTDARSEGATGRQSLRDKARRPIGY